MDKKIIKKISVNPRIMKPKFGYFGNSVEKQLIDGGFLYAGPFNKPQFLGTVTRQENPETGMIDFTQEIIVQEVIRERDESVAAWRMFGILVIVFGLIAFGAYLLDIARTPPKPECLIYKSK